MIKTYNHPECLKNGHNRETVISNCKKHKVQVCKTCGGGLKDE